MTRATRSAVGCALAMLLGGVAGAQPPAEVEQPAPAEDRMTVVGQRRDGPTAASPESVDVIDTAEARAEAADMGAVLDRATGVALRRSGGLGAPTTFYIHGLSEKRIRIFVDGVPAGAGGLGLDPSDLPVQLVERIEIYKGVVPIRFGADALGGAVNFVTRDAGSQSYAEASNTLGSFGTFRGSAVSRVVLSDDAGAFVDVDGFFDRAENDYDVDVQIPDARGRPQPVTVPLFHNGYEAHGLSARAGLMDRPWADRLVLGAFTERTRRDIQHGVTMSVPYGDIERHHASDGVNLHYRLRDRPRAPFGVELLLNYASIDARFDDISHNQWGWRGDVVRARPLPGERSRGERVLDTGARASGRLGLAYRVGLDDRFELSAAVDHRALDRQRVPTGENRIAVRREEYSLFKLVSGASWLHRLFAGRLENELFVKHYYARPEGPPRTTGVGTEELADARNDVGFGDGLRFGLLPALLHLKASYEYAVRLPDPDEIFGDGALLERTPDLRSETSHNANLGLVLEPVETALGRFEGSVHGFWRDTHDLIFLVPTLDSARYQNVSDVETLGVEASARWTGWEALTLSANATRLEAINRSTNGQFGKFEGDHMPNLPSLFGGFGVSAQQRLPALAIDRLRLYWRGRAVQGYFLFWESQGARATKLRVPTRITHDLGLSVMAGRGGLTASFEVHNVTDAERFDNVGIQLAGRSLHFKLGVGL